MIIDPPPPPQPKPSALVPSPPSLPSDSIPPVGRVDEGPAPNRASPPASPVRVLSAPLPPATSATPKTEAFFSPRSSPRATPAGLKSPPKGSPSTALAGLAGSSPSPSPAPPPPTPPQQVNGLPAAAPPPTTGLPPTSNGQGPMDSITLGQLKAAAAVVKPKPTQYDFRYEDSDTLMAELQEFFSYEDVNHLDRGLDAFQSSFPSDKEWMTQTASQKETFVQAELAKLTDRDANLDAAWSLFYILQGAFVDATSPEHQLHLIIENSRIVRKAGGLAILVDALKDASKRHDDTLSRSEHLRRDSFAPGTSEQPGDLGRIREEISLYLGMIYFVVEVSRGDDALAKELMGPSEPLVVFLMQMIGNLKDRQQSRNPDGYPTKRLILVTWKVLLACLGGLRDAQKVTKLSREMAGLSPAKEDWFGFTKTSPSDIRKFREETAVKYPTFAPKTFTDGVAISAEKLAEALTPIPVRPHYHAPPSSSLVEENFTSFIPRFSDFPSSFLSPSGGSSSQHPNGALPATPAPSPPPSPKPKKQMWQTDPARPFVFPFSRSAHGVDTMVPYAIDEADKLYKQHAHVSLGLYQLWKEREEFLKEEIGLGSTGILGFGVENAKVRVEGTDVEEVPTEEAVEDEILAEFKTRDAELRVKEEEESKEGNLKEVRAIREKRESLKKLERVEMIYRGLIPSALPAAVVVLLKLVFDSVPQPPAPVAPPNPTYPGGAAPSPAPQDPDAFEFHPPLPPPTLEEVDVIREREIAWKGVSAIILLLLKWFKCSHILKFQHISQLLVTMNCPVVMVKTFQYPEPVDIVKAKTDLTEKNFFRYCHVNLSRYPQKERPEDLLTVPTTRLVTRAGLGGGAGNKHPGASTDEEVELISEYSWRNFFSAINRTKIIQKLLKGRSEKIYQFNQHKPFNTFKRMLKVAHPMFQLQVLKIIKSQIPHYGKKWKQQNMKIVTAIYLNCRPDLRDEWLTVGMEAEELVESSLQEHALKSLVRFYHTKHYPSQITHETYGTLNHRRSHSAAGTGPASASHANGAFPVSPSSHHVRHSSSSSNGDGDLFPPNRSHPPSSSSAHHHAGSFPDELADSWQHEYEDVLDDVFGTSDIHTSGDAFGSDWGPLASSLNGLDIHGHGRWSFDDRSDEGEFTDGESVVSSIGTIGELGEDARLGDDEAVEDEEEGEVGDGEDFERAGEGRDEEAEKNGEDENKNNWEHMSPSTLLAMPRSPVALMHRRSSSGGSPLRPVMQGNGVDGPQSEDIALEDEEEVGPVPMTGAGGGGVDEVEYMFGV